jgi:hypothetical protein
MTCELDRSSYAIQHHPENIDCRIYHTRMLVTDYASQGVLRCEGAEDMVDGILAFVISLPGVIHAIAEPYKITVTKSPLYDWGEIEREILGLMKFSSIPELLRFPAPAGWLESE